MAAQRGYRRRRKGRIVNLYGKLGRREEGEGKEWQYTLVRRIVPQCQNPRPSNKGGIVGTNKIVIQLAYLTYPGPAPPALPGQEFFRSISWPGTQMLGLCGSGGRAISESR